MADRVGAGYFFPVHRSGRVVREHERDQVAGVTVVVRPLLPHAGGSVPLHDGDQLLDRLPLRNPADLARQVKELVQQYGAVAVSDMLSVFSD
jgi:hypothetical protein